MKPSIIHLVLICEDTIVDEIGSNSEVIGVKIEVKMTKFKNKNFIKLFWSKSKSFTENSGLGFFIPKARLAFTKLRQAFIKVSNLHDFDPKCHIHIEIDVSRYAINGIFNQLSLDNLGW